MKYLLIVAVYLSFPAFAQTKSIPMKSELQIMQQEIIAVRYIVTDVDAAVAFYTDLLGFKVNKHPGPGFADISIGNLHLLLNKPGGGGGSGQSMPDGAIPAPGGWNRIQLQVKDLSATVDHLKSKGAQFRNNIVIGNGGDQILLKDPSGNLIELFQPKP